MSSLCLLLLLGMASTGCVSLRADEMPVCDKILEGVQYSDKEWNEYLKKLHANISGVTRPFALFRTSLGPDTYNAFLNAVPDANVKGRAVLDLGCGDGFMTKTLWEKMQKNGLLTGLDLVPEEIEAARKYIGDPRVQLVAAPAQTTTLDSASQDTVVAHLVLMLTLPLDPVVDEIARVLKPGGSVYAVVTRPAPKGGYFSDLVGHMETYVKTKHPKYAGIRSGDARTQSVEELRKLFSPTRGFTKFDYTDYDMLVVETPENVWNEFFATLHRTLVLPEHERAELRDRMIAEMRKTADATGKVHLDFPLRMFNAQRAP